MRNVCFHDMVQRPVHRVEDCKRIKRIMLDNGFDFTLDQCEEFWECLSDYFSASWLILPENDETLWALLSTGRYPDELG